MVLEASGMINAQHLINDGLTSACKNNGKTTWTYNQGVILGGLSELNRLAPDPSTLETAASVATAAIANLTDSNGILHDTCEPNCGADGVQFKGIFVRNLAELAASQHRREYARFLDANAASILAHAQGPDYQFGLVWSGPFSSGNAAIQTSALDCLIAASQLRHAPPRRPEL
jgi:predicted alpha-1,6-mannanase (GH76 family)